MGSKFVYTDKRTGQEFQMPMAGKTGTTQNWGDAWAIGYSPYYTAAFWFGFDTPGNSMGMSGTGASLAGPPWGDFMKVIHKDLPYKDWPQPEEGVVKINVCDETGKLCVEGCREIALWFMTNNVPKETCDLHGVGHVNTEQRSEQMLQDALYQTGFSMDDFIDDSDLQTGLDLDSIIENSEKQEAAPSNELELPDLESGNSLME